MSVNDFEKQSAQQQTDSYKKVVDDAIAAAYHADEKLGDAVAAYFTTTPKGAVATLGYTAFDAELRQTLKDNQSTPAKLDSIQIEDICDDVIATYVMPNVAKKQPAPAIPAGPQVTK